MADNTMSKDAFPTMGGDDPNARQVGMSTFLIHGQQRTIKWDYSHHTVPPLSSSVTYRLDSAERGGRGFLQFGQGRDEDLEPVYIYDRLDEPTRSLLEDELARIEWGDVCATFATGMAAITASLGITLQAGDHLVAWGTLYGCTYSLMTRWLPRLGIEVSFADFTDLDAVRKAVKPNTRAMYLETPANPTMELVDLKALTALRDEFNAKRSAAERIWTIVDNTFATPMCQRPREWGIDIVVASLTKNIGGFGTDMGGAVVVNRELEEPLMMYRKDFGGVLAPKSAWPILVYGLPTLTLRSERQMATAQQVAAFLDQHPKVARVSYPGLPSHPQYDLAQRQMCTPNGEFAPGTLIYFETREEGAEPLRARKVIDYSAKHAYALTLAVSLGNVRTLIEAPGVMTHAALPPEAQERSRIAPNAIRLALGLEKAEDIIYDLDKALDYS